MSKFSLSAIIAVGFLCIGCNHQLVSERNGRGHPAGIKHSVLPVFVTEYATSDHRQLTREGSKTVTTANFRACSGVYVAPHLLATSVSAFPREQNGVSVYDPGSIAILDGTSWLRVSDVPFFDPETGLVLIRTDQVGVPLSLRDGALGDSETLKRVGYTFRLASSGILAIPSWDMGQATASYAVDSLSSTTMFSVRTDLHPGSCGSPIIGRDGTLVGIISRRIGKDEAIVIGPALIAQAVKSVSDE